MEVNSIAVFIVLWDSSSGELCAPCAHSGEAPWLCISFLHRGMESSWQMLFSYRFRWEIWTSSWAECSMTPKVSSPSLWRHRLVWVSVPPLWHWLFWSSSSYTGKKFWHCMRPLSSSQCFSVDMTKRVHFGPKQDYSFLYFVPNFEPLAVLDVGGMLPC